VRQRAFLLVSRIPALATQGVLQPHLADPDPEIRVAAIRAIPAAPDPPGLNLAARLLADPDPQVAKHAAMWLQKAAGQDFGIRFASPRDATVEGAEGVRTAPPSPAELGRLRAWLEVQPAFDPDVAGPTPPLLRRRPIADFELASLDGGRVRLSSYRGKVVILNFWATWCTACLGEIPTLNQLHRGRGERLVVLGIALDGAAHAHAGHDHGGEEEASHAHAEEATDVAAIRELVARTVQRRGLEYPVALDPEMKIGRRFDAGELPTQVVVDTEGRLVRRFVGPRQLDIFEAMVREAGTNP
jgi:peroxiredoxin